MNALVNVVGGKVVTDTQIIAKEFGLKHTRVMDVADRLFGKVAQIKGSTGVPLNFEKQRRDYRGQPFDVYVLGREAFSLLSMRFESDKALAWQVKFNNAFYSMESAILKEQNNRANLEWATARQQSKIARKEETDIIQRFIDYATAQGSASAKFYYKHVTMACYKCLQLVESRKPKVRDTLDLMELNQLVLAEVVAGRSLMRHMDSGEHYKAIYELVKQDLERFADGLMLPRLAATE